MHYIQYLNDSDYWEDMETCSYINEARLRIVELESLYPDLQFRVN